MKRCACWCLLVLWIAACGGGRGGAVGCYEIGSEDLSPGSRIHIHLKVSFFTVDAPFFANLGIPVGETPILVSNPFPTFGGVVRHGSTVAVDTRHFGGGEGSKTLLPQGQHAGAFFPVTLGPGIPQIGDTGVFVQAPGGNNDCLTVLQAIAAGLDGLQASLATIPLVPSGDAGSLEFSCEVLSAPTAAQFATALSTDPTAVEYVVPSIRVFPGQWVATTVYQTEADVADLGPNARAAWANYLDRISKVMAGVTIGLKAEFDPASGGVTLVVHPGSEMAVAVLDHQPSVGSPATPGFTPATTVQLPTFAFTSVATTVSVPDGGTVLLGGINRLGGGQTEKAGIPYVGRLFNNPAVARNVSSLMLMVTPRIIIQEEAEDG